MICLLQEAEALDFALEIGSKGVSTEVLAYLVHRPEATAIQFLTGRDGTVVGGAMYEDQFALAGRLEDIVCQALRLKVCYAQLFAHFAAQSHLYTLAQVDMATHGGVPPSRLDVFPGRALLQVEFAPTVE